MTTPQVVRADPAMRRKAVLIVIAGTVAAIVAIGYGLPWLERWVTDAIVAGNIAARRAVCLGAGAAVIGLALVVAVSGVNMVRIGRRVTGAGRFPPPGLRVLRDTRVVAGRQAVIIGRLQATLGLVILGCAAALLGIGGYVVVWLWP